jgi:hypothetical protein
MMLGDAKKLVSSDLKKNNYIEKFLKFLGAKNEHASEKLPFEIVRSIS